MSRRSTRWRGSPAAKDPGAICSRPPPWRRWGGRRVRAGGAACTLAEQPDQNTLYGVNPGGAHAQTFVPDATGPLQQAAVWVWKDRDSPDDFVVSVLRVDAAGTPRWRKPLARARVPATPLGGGQRQVVARFGRRRRPVLKAGTTYALAISRAGSGFSAMLRHNGGCAGQSFRFNPGSDTGFVALEPRFGMAFEVVLKP